MGKAIPPIEPNPAWDETLPDTAAIEAQRPVIEEYLHAVYGLDARPDGEWVCSARWGERRGTLNHLNHRLTQSLRSFGAQQ